MKATTSMSPTHDEIVKRGHDIWEIAKRALAIWKQSGRPQGQETTLWLQAERELRQERELRDIGNERSESAAPFASNKRSRGSRRVKIA